LAIGGRSLRGRNQFGARPGTYGSKQGGERYFSPKRNRVRTDTNGWGKLETVSEKAGGGVPFRVGGGIKKKLTPAIQGGGIFRKESVRNCPC